MYKLASIQKLRFASAKGDLTVEQLWDLPLQSKNGFDLDTLARIANTNLKSVTEDSFVTDYINPAKPRYALQLEIIKDIIAHKLKEAADRRSAAERAAKKAKLVSLLGEKQDEQLKALSAEELAKQIAEL